MKNNQLTWRIKQCWLRSHAFKTISFIRHSYCSQNLSLAFYGASRLLLLVEFYVWKPKTRGNVKSAEIEFTVGCFSEMIWECYKNIWYGNHPMKEKQKVGRGLLREGLYCFSDGLNEFFTTVWKMKYDFSEAWRKKDNWRFWKSWWIYKFWQIYGTLNDLCSLDEKVIHSYRNNFCQRIKMLTIDFLQLRSAKMQNERDGESDSLNMSLMR